MTGWAAAQEAPEVLPQAPAKAAVDTQVLTLDSCIAIGLQKQPAIAAAQASLASAETNARAVESMRLAGLIARDISIRKQQAAHGVTIAAAGVDQQLWETRYAITRNFYSVQYANLQQGVIKGVIEDLERSQEKAKNLVEKGEKTVLTRTDLERLNLNISLLRAKQAEAAVGVERALAALREAMGVGCGFTTNVAEAPLPSLVEDLELQPLICQALQTRAEMAQALHARDLVGLEADAQRRILIRPQAQTFASAADIHAKTIPQGTANGEYRPGAIGIEMPTNLVGHRKDRVERAEDLHGRAISVVDKTHNLISLEVEAAFLKWKEAAMRVRSLADAPATAAKVNTDVQDRFELGSVKGDELISASTLKAQAQAYYNESLYNHALALAALERVTGGAYRPTYAGPAPAAKEGE